MKKNILFITFWLLLQNSFSQDVSATLAGSLSAHLILGTQVKAVKFGLSIFGTATYKSFSAESGINFTLLPSIQKYGIYGRNLSSSLEVFALAGYGKNSNLLGSNIGLNNHTAFYDSQISSDFFYGIGQALTINKISGKLKKFENRQGAFLLRFSKEKRSFSIHFSNDATAPLFSNGSDKGMTARLLISYSEIRNDELLGFGLGLDMFTPEADYGRIPNNPLNSDDGSMLVSYNTKPYDDLFHLNLFASFLYQSAAFNFDGRVGVDSQKIGAYLQNTLHDSFGLYPRFSWDINQSSKFYSLIDINAKYPYYF